jgi:hypothetical protein
MNTAVSRIRTATIRQGNLRTPWNDGDFVVRYLMTDEELTNASRTSDRRVGVKT